MTGLVLNNIARKYLSVSRRTWRRKRQRQRPGRPIRECRWRCRRSAFPGSLVAASKSAAGRRCWPILSEGSPSSESGRGDQSASVASCGCDWRPAPMKSKSTTAVTTNWSLWLLRRLKRPRQRRPTSSAAWHLSAEAAVARAAAAVPPDPFWLPSARTKPWNSIRNE